MFFLSDDPLFSDEELLLMCAASGGKTVEDTATGNPLTFTADISKPLKSLLIPFTPQQEGSGDPSPSNIRSILPWDGLKVFGSGKNIVTDDFTNGVLSLETGKVTYNPQFVVSGFIPVKPLTSYYFRCPTVDKTELDIVYYDRDKQYIGYTDADGYSSCNTPGRSRKTPAGCYYVRIDARNAQYNNDICINYPASVTGYVPAVGITDTDIVFPSPVYGGTLDVVSGVLTVEWAEIASYNGETIPGEWLSDRDVYSAGTTPTIGAQVVYKLAEPQEQTLTGHQITALIGNNTIWSDADGSMTAVYLKNG